MNEPEAEALRQLMRERSAALAEAVRSGHSVGTEEIESLERLTRLVALRSDPETTGPRLWPVILLLAGTLLLVSLLLYARVSETEIEVEIAATEVGFTLPRQDLVLRNALLESLGVSGLSRIGLPEELSSSFGDRDADPELGIHLALADATSGNSSIMIGALAPPASTAVRLRQTDAREYRLSMRTPGLILRVDVFGHIVISMAGAGRRAVELAIPDAITLESRPAPDVVDLDLRFRHLERNLAVQLPVHDLSFTRVDEFGDRDISLVRALSTIVSGTLYLESLNGAAVPLRAGERLRFDRAEGEIRSLQLQDDHLWLAWRGRVSGMRTGSDAHPRSLMPTWLEWLRARHSLSLLWGSTLYLFGITLGVLRWLKLPA